MCMGTCQWLQWPGTLAVDSCGGGQLTIHLWGQLIAASFDYHPSVFLTEGEGARQPSAHGLCTLPFVSGLSDIRKDWPWLGGTAVEYGNPNGQLTGNPTNRTTPDQWRGITGKRASHVHVRQYLTFLFGKQAVCSRLFIQNSLAHGAKGYWIPFKNKGRGSRQKLFNFRSAPPHLEFNFRGAPFWNLISGAPPLEFDFLPTSPPLIF